LKFFILLLCFIIVFFFGISFTDSFFSIVNMLKLNVIRGDKSIIFYGLVHVYMYYLLVLYIPSCLISHFSHLVTFTDMTLWEIRRNLITGHMQVALYHVFYRPMKIPLRQLWKYYDLKLNSLFCNKQFDWSKKVTSHIYNVIKYSWNRVTCMWLVMWFLQISNDVTPVKGNGWEMWF
jgi:hypothetical protein